MANTAHTYTAAKGKRFITYLQRCGGFIEVACALSKIRRRTLYDWLKRGEAGEAPFAGFLAEVLETRAKAVTTQLGNQRKVAGGKTLKASDASAWLLERLMPAQFGTRAQLMAAGQEYVEHMLDQVQPLMSTAAYGELIDALARIAGHGPVAGGQDGRAQPGGGERPALPRNTG